MPVRRKARVARAPSPANPLERLVNLRPAQRHLLRRLPCLRSLLECGVEQARMSDLLARQQFFDGKDLDARVFVFESGRFVESGFGGLFQHGLGRRFHADQHPDLRVFAFDDAAQVAHVGGLNVSGFDGKDNLLVLAATGFRRGSRGGLAFHLCFGNWGKRHHVALRVKDCFPTRGGEHGIGVLFKKLSRCEEVRCSHQRDT